MTISQKITIRWIDKEVVVAIHDQQIAEHNQSVEEQDRRDREVEEAPTERIFPA